MTNLPSVPGELGGDEERLGEEPLDFSCPADGDLILLGEFVHAEDRDDVLEVLVFLKRHLDKARHLVVFLAQDDRIQDAGRWNRADPRRGRCRVYSRHRRLLLCKRDVPDSCSPGAKLEALFRHKVFCLLIVKGKTSQEMIAMLSSHGGTPDSTSVETDIAFTGYLRLSLLPDHAYGIKSQPATTGCNKIPLTYKTPFPYLQLSKSKFLSIQFNVKFSSANADIISTIASAVLSMDANRLSKKGFPSGMPSSKV